jgi:alpha-L-fucosidase 2
MIYENNRDLLQLAKILATNDATVARVKAQIEKYDPIQIGESGQIKEYREEKKYGEIGEYRHRHISQLVCLMPGTQVTRETPELLAAARYTLNERGDESTGWALAHRICAWARALDGDRAHRLLTNLLATRTYANLWDMHPPFQIDGNFGATAGIAEMLLQSHAGYIDLLPALPKAWAKRGSFKGLCARGGYVVDCEWCDGKPVKVKITSKYGSKADIRFNGKPYNN